ncbi:hypothetical protein PR048_019804 [Dryococelus australis]|uniref:Uncharacterized protein n=1 Tax=Dryococelus australis TaxID=614101 RepID=A0ABQ9H4H4_9NEOP|nr:hypothetical protein PR048_019804 [Dryococelus australis]
MVVHTKQMIDLHIKLCDTVEMMSSAHGLHVVLWLFTASLVFTSITYSMMMFSLYSNTQHAPVYINFVLWGGFNVTRL